MKEWKNGQVENIICQGLGTRHTKLQNSSKFTLQIIFHSLTNGSFLRVRAAERTTCVNDPCVATGRRFRD